MHRELALLTHALHGLLHVSMHSKIYVQGWNTDSAMVNSAGNETAKR